MSGSRFDLFSSLHCPVDGGRLKLEILRQDSGGGPETALLLGSRHTYPVILGIPRVIADSTRAPLVAMLRRGAYDAAADLALSWPDKNLSNRLRRKASDLLLQVAPGLPPAQALAAHLSTGRDLRGGHATVEELLRHLQSGLFAEWLLHRFSARTFRPLMTLSRLLRPEDLVLDVGGGFGHGAWVLSHRVAPEQIVMVDSVFAHLHVARTRMAPGVRCVAFDANNGLPFRDAAFDAVVMSDTFHFVTEQERLAGDAMRLLSAKGRLILSQIHNGLIEDDFTGAPRSPDGYLDLFPELNRTLVSNKSLRATLERDAALEISEKADIPGLNAVAELSLVADRDGSAFGLHPSPEPDLRNLHLASVLKVSPQDTLERNVHIPPVVTRYIDWPDVTGTAGSDALKRGGTNGEAMMRKGILVSTPPAYFRTS